MRSMNGPHPGGKMMGQTVNTVALPGRILLVGAAEALAPLAATIGSQTWSYTTVCSPREALRCVREDPSIDLLVLVPSDELSPHTELCRAVKFDSRSAFVSVIVLLPKHHADRSTDVFEAGADDCIPASASQRELLLRMLKAIRFKQATDSLEDSAAVITALANAVEGKDHYTCGHVERVGMYAVRIGREAGVDADGLTALKMGGVVHDIGKIGIPDQVLNKPGKLTDEEMAIMKRHPVIGYDILKPLRTFHDVLPIIRWHHEKPNGGGYPDGLAGDDVPLLPRITAVADVFDALATDRPYRKGFPIAKCREILLDMGAKGDLDTDLVNMLFHVLDAGGLMAAAA